MIIAVCVAISKESERHHSLGSPLDGAHPSLKTDRDHLMKGNLGRYRSKTFDTAKGRKEKWCRQKSN